MLTRRDWITATEESEIPHVDGSSLERFAAAAARLGAEHGLGAAAATAAAAGEGKRMEGKEFICGALVFRVWRGCCLLCDPCFWIEPTVVMLAR